MSGSVFRRRDGIADGGGAERPRKDRLRGATATVYSSNFSLINRLIERVRLSQVTGSSLPGNNWEPK